MQDDSFLEEMNLVPAAAHNSGAMVHHAEKYNNITTRILQSPTITVCSEREDLEAILRQQRQSTVSPSVTVKASSRRSIETLSPILPVSDSHLKRKDDLREKISPSIKKQLKDKEKDFKNSSFIKTTKTTDKKTKDDKLKPVENIERSMDTLKVNSVSKTRTKATGSKDSRLSDGSYKENSKPDLSEDLSTDGGKEWRRITTDSIKNKELSDDYEALAMLPAIKDIVSQYTKIESAKVMTAMQIQSSKIMKMMEDLYINSQSTLIKQLILLSDDICDAKPVSDNSRLHYLVQENNRLLETIEVLNARIDELKKKADTVDDIRRENKALRFKIKELEK
ncbi:uncharacterized protein LOC130670297 [Microplitis mediator]|uniref:uncharacterized protein LOC130670297 n=1 Tax=Microplitis mediator TaxID=375433 RepID=UPI002555BA68|nr:uncharacterized protein LOC130670297 [Microplitis mediator]XP_057329623.1 uncharacterized protein LOC130670297 [Microplitis mediator]